MMDSGRARRISRRQAWPPLRPLRSRFFASSRTRVCGRGAPSCSGASGMSSAGDGVVDGSADAPIVVPDTGGPSSDRRLSRVTACGSPAKCCGGKGREGGRGEVSGGRGGGSGGRGNACDGRAFPASDRRPGGGVARVARDRSASRMPRHVCTTFAGPSEPGYDPMGERLPLCGGRRPACAGARGLAGLAPVFPPRPAACARLRPRLRARSSVPLAAAPSARGGSGAWATHVVDQDRICSDAMDAGERQGDEGAISVWRGGRGGEGWVRGGSSAAEPR